MQFAPVYSVTGKRLVTCRKSNGSATSDPLGPDAAAPLRPSEETLALSATGGRSV